MRNGLAATLVLVSLLTPVKAAPSEGADLVGKACPEWAADRWVQGGPLRLSDLRGKVVLLRFFTSSDCPHCRATAPALVALDHEFGPKGLVVVGMYTPKPDPRPVTDEEALGAVAEYGFRFPVAVDASWATLDRLWLDRVPHASFTSASLLIDRHGIVRHVQRGGIYSPDSDDPGARADYQSMREAIVKWTGER